MANRIYFKPINELTSEEFMQLFKEIVYFPKKFKENYGNYSIATFPNVSPQETDNPYEAYLFGLIYGLKTHIPKNKLICLFGAPGCGKSHLIRLVAELKGKSIEEIKNIIIDAKVDDIVAFNIKKLVDSLVIVPKKTTRLRRKNEKLNNPEIIEGVSREEVQSCDFSYEYSDNLYGISKKDINEALLDGSALMIINNLETLKKLYIEYNNQLYPVYIYRDSTQEAWVESMQKSGRSPQEIRTRVHAYQKSIDLYKQINMTLPEAIINNLEFFNSNTVTLLLQLKRILDRNKENERRMMLE